MSAPLIGITPVLSDEVVVLLASLTEHVEELFMAGTARPSPA